MVSVAADGTVTIPSETVPVSSLLSPEAKAYVAQHLKDMQDPSATYAEKGIPRFMLSYLAKQKAMFPVEQQDTKIGGVHVVIFSPKQGVARENAKRVLINLHGGGFSGCWPGCSLLESIPIASVGGFKVVSVDYRQGPDYHFPAASEDVAKVYSALLKDYPAQNVGIYGCSAGGGLTAMSVAWFQKHDLPAPGAIGIFCAGAGGFGPAGAGSERFGAEIIGRAEAARDDAGAYRSGKQSFYDSCSRLRRAPGARSGLRAARAAERATASPAPSAVRPTKHPAPYDHPR